MRLVKGAYKEDEQIAYQTKEEIDANYIKIIEASLTAKNYTSIATHDDQIINHNNLLNHIILTDDWRLSQNEYSLYSSTRIISNLYCPPWQ